MALRDLRVDIRTIIDARQRSTDDPVEPCLDLKTGEVLESIDEASSGEPDQVGALLESEPDRLVFIAREEGSNGWRRTSDFAARVAEEDLRGALQAALEGRGAFGRFRATIGRYPDLREEWEVAEWNGHAREIELWLESLGVRAVYDRPTRARPEPEGESAKRGDERFIEGKSVYDRQQLAQLRVVDRHLTRTSQTIHNQDSTSPQTTPAFRVCEVDLQHMCPRYFTARRGRHVSGLGPWDNVASDLRQPWDSAVALRHRRPWVGGDFQQSRWGPLKAAGPALRRRSSAVPSAS